MIFNNFNVNFTKYNFDKTCKFFFPKKIIENEKIFNQIKRYLVKKKIINKSKFILSFDFLFRLFNIKRYSK